MKPPFDYTHLDKRIEAALKHGIEPIKMPSEQDILASWEKVRTLLAQQNRKEISEDESWIDSQV